MIYMFCFFQVDFFFLVVRGMYFIELSVFSLWIFEAEQHLNLCESINGAVGNVSLLVENFAAKSNVVGFKLGKK